MDSETDRSKRVNEGEDLPGKAIFCRLFNKENITTGNENTILVFD